MLEITYKDYYKYKSTMEKMKVITFKENKEIYKYEEGNFHDELFNNLLNNKTEIIKLLNDYLKLKNRVEKEDIEKVKNIFTENKKADAIYKLKDKNIYFLIRHLSQIDYSMPYEILNYSIDIIRNAVDIKQIQTSIYRYPRVIPIIIYTGNRQWKSKKSIVKVQENLDGYEREDLNVKYNLFDINVCSKNRLLKTDSLITNLMAIQKCKTKEEILEVIDNIISNARNKNERKIIKNIIEYLEYELSNGFRHLSIKDIKGLEFNELKEKLIIDKKGEDIL